MAIPVRRPHGRSGHFWNPPATGTAGTWRRSSDFHRRRGAKAMREQTMKRLVLAAAAVLLAAAPAGAKQVGEISTDWTGNDIVVEAVNDPQVQGVTCHLTYFSRGLIDRMSKGNWFEDPSNSSIACRQTGPITIGDIETDENGEEVFSEGRSLIFKSLRVRRIYDRENNTLIYVSYSRQIKDSSAKMAISTVPLFDRQVSWSKGRPE
ncbi:CreA family protein [Roseomonas sp. E05]|uniref:CreA family protein n=1 Tax=Roseomonas sp. E05 TaxID=3046310 RepID=UPI0024BA548F|nr:CreA family protein [Roseomonas sp. E05]MDJ0386974.1 CreA family protein [Roseomonas sp. E05]